MGGGGGGVVAYPTSTHNGGGSGREDKTCQVRETFQAERRRRHCRLCYASLTHLAADSNQSPWRPTALTAPRTTQAREPKTQMHANPKSKTPKMLIPGRSANYTIVIVDRGTGALVDQKDQ